MCKDSSAKYYQQTEKEFFKRLSKGIKIFMKKKEIQKVTI